MGHVFAQQLLNAHRTADTDLDMGIWQKLLSQVWRTDHSTIYMAGHQAAHDWVMLRYSQEGLS